MISENNMRLDVAQRPPPPKPMLKKRCDYERQEPEALALLFPNPWGGHLANLGAEAAIATLLNIGLGEGGSELISGCQLTIRNFPLALFFPPAVAPHLNLGHPHLTWYTLNDRPVLQ